jgi:hypothetical protein
MNGRVYDPVIARFLSPDPYVQAPESSQNFNRYSYALNNPLKYTDPSGNFIYVIPSVSGSGSGISMSLTVGLGFGPALGVDITVGYDTYSSGFSVSIGAHAGVVANVYAGWGNKTGWFAGAGIGFSIGVPNTGTNMTSVGVHISERGGLSVSAFGFTYADNHWRFNPSVSFSKKFEFGSGSSAVSDATQAAPEANSDVSLKVKAKTPDNIIGTITIEKMEVVLIEILELNSNNGEQVQKKVENEQNGGGPVTIDNTSQALDYYYNGNGDPVLLGPQTQKQLFKNPDYIRVKGALINGTANSRTNTFDVDLTWQDNTFHIGDSNVDYYTKCSPSTCVTRFEAFVRDGFSDPLGIGIELGGTPYPYIPFKFTIKYKNPGYPTGVNIK